MHAFFVILYLNSPKLGVKFFVAGINARSLPDDVNDV